MELIGDCGKEAAIEIETLLDTLITLGSSLNKQRAQLRVQKEYTTSQREVVPGNQKTSTWIEKEKKRRKDAVKKKFTDAQLAEVGGLDYDHAMKTPRCSILFSASRTRRLTMAITVCVKNKPFCALHHVCSLCASPYDNNKKEALPHDKQKVT